MALQFRPDLRTKTSVSVRKQLKLALRFGHAGRIYQISLTYR